MNFLVTSYQDIGVSEDFYDPEEFISDSLEPSSLYPSEVSLHAWRAQISEPVNAWIVGQFKSIAAVEFLLDSKKTSSPDFSKIDAIIAEAARRLVAHENSQLALPMAASFVPSEELIDAWKENVSSFASKEAIALIRTNEAARQFAFMMKRLVGAFAQERRYADKSIVTIVDGKGFFETTFQLDVSERFLLLPQKSTRFFELLYRDFRLHSNLVVFSGAWGVLEKSEDGAVQLKLSPPKTVKRAGFVKGREVR